MNPFFKALVGIVVVAVLAGLGIAYQFRGGSLSGGKVGLTRDELNLFVEKNLGARERAELATNAESRKKFLENLQKQLSLAAEAQRLELDQSESMKALEELNTAQVLQAVYVEAHPELAKAAGQPQQPQQQQRGPQASPEEVKAWVDTHAPDVARYQAAIAERAQGMPAPKPEDLATAFVFAEKARAEGLQNKPETQLQLKLERYTLLIQTLAEKLQKESEYTDEEVKQYYETNKASGRLDKVQAAHILFATVAMPSPENPMGGGAAPDKEAKRKLAEEVLVRVKNNEDFGELAKQYSDDPGSKPKGGDMGLSEPFRFVKEFEDAAWALKPGETSGIVESEFGFHIIKVLAREPAGELTPQMTSQLKDTLSQKRFEEKIEEIAKNASVSVPPDFDVTAPPPQEQMPMMPGGMNPHGGGGDPHGGQMPVPPPDGGQGAR